jgi:hypothetical protein
VTPATGTVSFPDAVCCAQTGNSAAKHSMAGIPATAIDKLNNFSGFRIVTPATIRDLAGRF